MNGVLIPRRRVSITGTFLGLLLLVTALLGASPSTAAGTYTFHGMPTDQTTKLNTAPGTATFSSAATTGTAPIAQTGSWAADADSVGNALAIYWSGPFSGTVNGVLQLDWWWSTVNPETAALGGNVEVSVFADPDYAAANDLQPQRLIGRAIVQLNGIGAAPAKFTSIVPVNGTVASTLLISVVPYYSDSGNGMSVYYDSTTTPSGFQFLATNPNPAPQPAPQASGKPARFSIFNPTAAQIAAGFGNPSSSEPSIGVSWITGKVFHQSILQTLRVSFLDDCPQTPASIWDAVESPLTGTESFDPILYTDSAVGRTIVSQLMLGTTTSASAFSDNDGQTWTPSTGAGIASGIDHQTLGGGPFHAPIPSGATYPNAVYYCAQDIAEAGCALSLNGGLSYGPAVPIYDALDCGGLHGHVKVGPDGTVYVPNKGCGSGQGVVVSEDNGVTWTVRLIPNSLPAGSDPSVAIDKGGRLYVGYAYNNNLASAAVSDDHGRTWKSFYDVGAAFGIKNVVFPTVVAGDAGRAAFVFLGTPTPGELDGPTFPGVWHLYVATTFDGGDHWITADATPNDPVQRGCIWLGGGANICRNLLDFMGATIDAQGRILVGFADGCVGPCAQAPATATGNAYTAIAAIARQTGGRRMFAAYDPPEQTPPSAPSLTVTRNGAVAHITWSEGNDGASAITGYKVLRGLASGQETFLASVGTATRFDDPTIDPAKTYFYKVVATNASGDSCGSNEAAAAPAGSSCTLPGIRVVTDHTGDQTGAPLNTALDVQSVSIAEPYLGDGTKKLFFTMKVASLASLPSSAQWRVLWNSPDAPAGQFWVGMSTSASGAVSFEYGTVAVTSAVVTSVGQFTTVGAAAPESRYTTDGTITLAVPNDAVGAPEAGDIIGGVIGRTYIVAGSAVTTYRGAVDTTDAAADAYAVVGNAYCAPAATSCLEDDDAHIAYSAGWHLFSTPKATAGHVRWTSGTGTATLTIDVAAGQFGTITYDYPTTKTGGTAAVTLDGTPQPTINYRGANGTTQEPIFGVHATYGPLGPGSHTLRIQGNGDGGVYVDRFCLTSSSSNAHPSSGPGATTSTSGTVAPAQQLLKTVTVPAGATSISVAAEATPRVPFQLVLVDPKGLALQTATPNPTTGFAVIERPVTAGGAYVVKVVNVSAGPIQVWAAATPQVAR